MSLTGWVIKNGKRPADEPPAAAEPEAKAAKLAVETSAGASSSSANPLTEPKAALADPPAGTPEGDLFGQLADAGWRDALRPYCSKAPFRKLAADVAAQRRTKTVFPPEAEVFNAFNATPLADVRVVILGQDPYHGPGQAHGLCFSVRRGVPPPPSLKNIYKELATDLPGFVKPDHGNLQSWAEQGVFLLNASLSVRQGEANSHAKLGWQEFTDEVIKVLNRQPQKIVFILWGGFAQKKACRLNEAKHCVLKAAHPSPLSVTKFLGCKVFSRANAFLAKEGKEEVDWRVPA